MHRFFVEPENIKGEWALLDAAQTRHIQVVLRLLPGEIIGLFDGRGSEYKARLEDLEGACYTTRLLSQEQQSREPGLRLYLVQSLAKGDKMDFIVQKAVEIGIYGIYPVESERSIVSLSPERAAKKVERWQSIAREACKQCKRSYIPPVYPVQSLKQYISNCGQHQDILLYEDSQTRGLKELLRDPGLSWGDEMGIIIGPEGGFTPEEVRAARDRGIQAGGLGPRILRTETAGLVAASIILYERNELG
ncbi:MAG: 16S rRNA (uracil(1498)-N(3))-methyltransferase [Syntrophomonas sp.]